MLPLCTHSCTGVTVTVFCKAKNHIFDLLFRGEFIPFGNIVTNLACIMSAFNKCKYIFSGELRGISLMIVSPVTITSLCPTEVKGQLLLWQE